MGDIGILTVATNRYIDFYSDLMESFWNSNGYQTDVAFHVFTNEVVRASEIQRNFPKLNIVIHHIENLKWPDATLKRFELYKQFINEIPQQFLVHLDADMIFLGKVNDLKEKIFSQTKMTLVAHPGYYRPPFPERISLYLSHCTYIFRDVRLFLKYGAIGSWETRPLSSSFLERKKRRNYVCGGIWFGPRDSFESLISWCSESVMQDTSKGFIAKWHDESYLNAWAGKHDYDLEHPSLCFESRYIHLKGINGLIEAVDKFNGGFNRV